MNERPSLPGAGLPTGKGTRLHRHGLGGGSGTANLLPYDRCLEQGLRDFFATPAVADPAYIVRLVVEGELSRVALKAGNAEKFCWDYAGEVPLIPKSNDSTGLPPLDASLAHVGLPGQAEDSCAGPDRPRGRRCARYADHRLGPPAGKRGRGGRQAAHLLRRRLWGPHAAERGADVIEVNFPDATATRGVNGPYERDFVQQPVDAVVASAGRAMVVLSGDEKAAGDAVLTRTREAMDAGATGVIYGCDPGQRDHDDSLRFAGQLKHMSSHSPSSTEESS